MGFEVQRPIRFCFATKTRDLVQWLKVKALHAISNNASEWIVDEVELKRLVGLVDRGECLFNNCVRKKKKKRVRFVQKKMKCRNFRFSFSINL